MPGLGTRLPVLFDAAITRDRIDLTDFIRVTATNPAKRYGLYPRKGTIAPGSDADLVLWDPAIRKMISPELFESAIDYTPYDGREVTGWPVATYLRGRWPWGMVCSIPFQETDCI
ncbi:amidohydrolase family protein [Asaia platycodi]|uniref:amidohydrolase family protein n=1 Tax=Asaia platycodi TaxID=610243 RepID=UPI002412897A|nr:amidohydrolase family protein [Asaia platycodi]